MIGDMMSKEYNDRQHRPLRAEYQRPAVAPATAAVQKPVSK